VVLERVEQIGGWELSHLRRHERRLGQAQDERGVVRGEPSPRGVVAAAMRRNQVFPMVRITALFDTGVRISTAFRGWDVCNNNDGGIKLRDDPTY
jgi:hypothetical protein